MSSWITGILIAAATTLVLGLAINPRMEARSRRILAAHAARDEFNHRVVVILAACARLRESPPVPGLADRRPELAQKLDAERQRWLDQLDNATRYLIDNLEGFALGYPTARIRNIITGFAGNARGVVLSERPVDKKVEQLTALAGSAQNIFFVRRWRVPSIVTGFASFEQAATELDEDLPEGAAAGTTPGHDDHVTPGRAPGSRSWGPTGSGGVSATDRAASRPAHAPPRQQGR